MGYFDHFANSPSTPIGDWITRRTKALEFSIIKNFLPNKECAILEIGPGNGDLVKLFLNSGYLNYTIIEPNDIMRSRFSSMGIMCKSYTVPPLNEEDEYYDAIILVDVFEHLNDTREARLFIAEAYRVLRTKGILCIVSPDYLHWKNDFFECDYTHSNITSIRRTIQLFYNNKFQIRKYVYLSGFFQGKLATISSIITRIVLW